MPAIVLRTRRGMSTYVSVVISPATTTRPVVIMVSQATRPCGSSVSTASRTESETWSAILSGWPSVTDSDVKEKERFAMAARLADGQEGGDGGLSGALRAVGREGAELRQPRRQLHPGEGQQRQRVLRVHVREAGRLFRHARLLLGLEEARVGGELRAA